MDWHASGGQSLSAIISRENQLCLRNFTLPWPIAVLVCEKAPERPGLPITTSTRTRVIELFVGCMVGCDLWFPSRGSGCQPYTLLTLLAHPLFSAKNRFACVSWLCPHAHTGDADRGGPCQQYAKRPREHNFLLLSWYSDLMWEKAPDRKDQLSQSISISYWNHHEGCSALLAFPFHFVPTPDGIFVSKKIYSYSRWNKIHRPLVEFEQRDVSSRQTGPCMHVVWQYFTTVIFQQYTSLHLHISTSKLKSPFLKNEVNLNTLDDLPVDNEYIA